MSGSDDVEVRLCDQKCINEFGRLNNRLVELRSESKQASSDLEKFDDAVTDLMMVVDGQIMLYMGETFVEVSEEVANEYCEEKVEVSHFSSFSEFCFDCICIFQIIFIEIKSTN